MNKKKGKYFDCLNCNRQIYRQLSEIGKYMFCNRSCKTIYFRTNGFPKEFKDKINEGIAKRPRNSWAKGWHHSEENKKHLSLLLKGKPQRKRTKEEKEYLSLIRKGNGGYKWKSEEGRRKMSEIRKKNPIIHRGAECNFWKGGINAIKDTIRKSSFYKKWWSDCACRDNFSCQICGLRDGKIQIHHKIPLSSIIDFIKHKYGKEDLIRKVMNFPLLFDKDNGLTLCPNCHKNTDTFLKHINHTKYYQQIEDYLLKIKFNPNAI